MNIKFQQKWRNLQRAGHKARDLGVDPESEPFPKPREESALEKKNEDYPLLKGSQQCENGEVATHSLGRRSGPWWVGKTRQCRNTGWRRYLLFEGSFVVKGI